MSGNANDTGSHAREGHTQRVASPVITACICTHNGSERLVESLWSLVCQSAPNELFEILVVDNASDDAAETRALVHDFLQQGHCVGLVVEPNLGLAHAKNTAVKNAHGEYVYFLDDDAVANPRLVESYLEAIAQHRPDVLGGHIHPMFDILPPPEMDYSQWSIWSLRHFGAGDRWLEDGEYFLGGNLCVNRSLLEDRPHDPSLGRCGGELRGGEEWYLGDPSFKRRMVEGGYIFHHAKEDRTHLDYALRISCAPAPRPAPTTNGSRKVRGSYLLNAWAREVALVFKRIAFQLRLARASRRAG